jgi:quercetin dioxygenase-like cupin family protein
MIIQGKVWGTTSEVYKDKSVSVNYLLIKKGGHSSEHRHTFKDNIFIVLLGLLKVKVWREGDLVDESHIWPGSETMVPAGVWHSFEALQDSTVIEIYTSGLRDPDIERRNQGTCKAAEARSGD